MYSLGYIRECYVKILKPRNRSLKIPFDVRSDIAIRRYVELRTSSFNPHSQSHSDSLFDTALHIRTLGTEIKFIYLFLSYRSSIFTQEFLLFFLCTQLLGAHDCLFSTKLECLDCIVWRYFSSKTEECFSFHFRQWISVVRSLANDLVEFVSIFFPSFEYPICQPPTFSQQKLLPFKKTSTRVRRFVTDSQKFVPKSEGSVTRSILFVAFRTGFQTPIFSAGCIHRHCTNTTKSVSTCFSVSPTFQPLF